jgi:DNA polymerase III subunit delta
VITGSDRPKIETALARLRGHFAAEAVEIVSALDTSGEDAVGLCNAGSLFGDARLIVVTDVDGAKQSEGRRKGGWKTADVEAITAYLASPAPATVLALVAEELKSSSTLWKACAKSGDVLTYEVEKKKLHEWVAAQFAQREARAESDAISALIQLVGDDLTALAGEVDKLATWAAGEPFGEREVEALVAARGDVAGYELTEAWANRDVGRVLELSEMSFEREPKPRRDVAPRMAGQLGSHLGRLRAIKRLAAEGLTSKEVAARLKLHPFYAGKLYRQADGFTEEDLDDAVVRLAQLDGALKGQSRLTPDLEVQRTLVDLTRRRAAAPASGR